MTITEEEIQIHALASEADVRMFLYDMLVYGLKKHTEEYSRSYGKSAELTEMKGEQAKKWLLGKPYKIK